MYGFIILFGEAYGCHRFSSSCIKVDQQVVQHNKNNHVCMLWLASGLGSTLARYFIWKASHYVVCYEEEGVSAFLAELRYGDGDRALRCNTESNRCVSCTLCLQQRGNTWVIRCSNHRTITRCITKSPVVEHQRT